MVKKYLEYTIMEVVERQEYMEVITEIMVMVMLTVEEETVVFKIVQEVMVQQEELY